MDKIYTKEEYSKKYPGIELLKNIKEIDDKVLENEKNFSLKTIYLVMFGTGIFTKSMKELLVKFNEQLQQTRAILEDKKISTENQINEYSYLETLAHDIIDVLKNSDKFLKEAERTIYFLRVDEDELKRNLARFLQLEGKNIFEPPYLSSVEEHKRRRDLEDKIARLSEIIKKDLENLEGIVSSMSRGVKEIIESEELIDKILMQIKKLKEPLLNLSKIKTIMDRVTKIVNGMVNDAEKNIEKESEEKKIAELRHQYITELILDLMTKYKG